jgi:hypothetical protein
MCRPITNSINKLMAVAYSYNIISKPVFTVEAVVYLSRVVTYNYQMFVTLSLGLTFSIAWCVGLITNISVRDLKLLLLPLND